GCSAGRAGATPDRRHLPTGTGRAGGTPAARSGPAARPPRRPAARRAPRGRGCRRARVPPCSSAPPSSGTTLESPPTGLQGDTSILRGTDISTLRLHLTWQPSRANAVYDKRRPATVTTAGVGVGFRPFLPTCPSSMLPTF